ncbi:MAG: hypothetical protein KatS3mg019_0278 [Fimbriimonadales bacterium]|nr:MAG: hypothetical protein KatS3mg019_0278 [Fimbriimonadales bacterium]
MKRFPQLFRQLALRFTMLLSCRALPHALRFHARKWIPKPYDKLERVGIPHTLLNRST